MRVLPDARAVRGHLADGGRVLVIDAHRLADAGDTEPLAPRERFRSGRRAVWVLGPEDVR